jgi:hypothetical protein
MLVDVEYRSTPAAGLGINQVFAGGRQAGSQALYGLSAGDQVGALWRSLDSGSGVVERLAQDIFAAQVRVRVWNFWTPSVPNFDSGFQALDPGQDLALQHGLRGDPGRYLVDLQFSSPVYGIHQRGLGGMDNQYYEEVGAYWHNLDGQSVAIQRRAEGILAPATPQARLRLWVMPRPDFDSGWSDITPGQSLVLTHNLGGSPEDYLVDMQFSGPQLGTHLSGYGGYDITDPSSPRAGSHVGAAWQGLTASALTVIRAVDDLEIGQVRVRLWRVSQPAWRTWSNMVPGWLDFTHGLGYPAGRYFVQMLFKTYAPIGLNQQKYGGMFYGGHPTQWFVEGDDVGGYWSRLDESGIRLVRMSRDSFLEQAQVRLWVLPRRTMFMPCVYSIP